MNPPKSRVRRGSLTRQVILQAALSLVDHEGSGSLTMRRLAKELGVAPMSLYNHVRTREDLLDGLSEVLIEEVVVEPGGNSSPEKALRAFAEGIRGVARAHPAAFELVGMRPLRTKAALGQIESVLSVLRTARLTESDSVDAYRAIASYARGFALAEIAGFTLESSGAETGTATGSEMTASEEFPTIAELSPWLGATDRDESFQFGLDAILAGIKLLGSE